MNFLRRLFGASTPKERDALIMEVEVVPQQLAVRVYRHTIDTAPGPITVWTYLTAGLERLGHREIRMTFPEVERADGCYDEPFGLLREIHGMTVQGGRVGPFGQTSFRHDWMGFRRIVYVDATHFNPFAGVVTPSGALHAIFLKERESAEVEQAGAALRQLARIGHHYRHYPWPPWCDPGRPDLGPTTDSAPSLLAKLGWIPAWSCSVVGDGASVTIQVPPSEARALGSRLATVPSGAACALSLGLDAAAHGCHVWFPGESGAMAITPGQLWAPDQMQAAPTDARLGGCFLAFALGADWSGASQVEDGFVVVLTDVDWRRVRQALERGEALTVEPTSPDRLPFVIRSTEEVYVNPVDGLEYNARWSTYTPVGGPRAQDLPPGTAVSWRLLTSESDLAARTSVSELVEFGQRAEATMVRLLAESGGSGELTIQFDCEPEGFAVRLAPRGSFSAAVLRMLESQLASLAPLRPTGSVSFQLEATFEDRTAAE